MLTGRRLARRSGDSVRALAVAATIVSMVAATAVASAAPARRPSLTGSGSSVPAAAATQTAFTISGAVVGLYPGRSTTLRLTVTNREPFPIVVTTITAAVSDATPQCRAGELSVAGFSGQVPVGAGQYAAVDLPVLMRHDAPDPCQGAIFPLRYSGSAVKR